MTTTTKHTPGPWHADCYLTVRTQQGTGIAQTLTKYTTLNEAPHNARLIAAAPDLLEALEAIAAAGDAAKDSAMGEGWVKAHEKFASFARSALAKARGEG